MNPVIEQQFSSGAGATVRYGDYRDSHLQAGLGYAAFVRQNAYVAMLWQLERQALRDIIVARYGQGRASHLDFACGTGRILEGLRGAVRSSVGIDISGSMLGMARRACPDARLVLGDLSSGAAFQPGVRFDVITAFRFFLNAEPALRATILNALQALLAPGGVLILNVHRHHGSCTYRMLRAAGRPPAMLACMRHDEVERMLAAAGLTILEERHAGILPATEQRTLLPVSVMAPVERVLSRVPALRHVANDRVYVCAVR